MHDEARVLVTGGAGFLGSNLVERCLDLGHEVTVLDALVEGSGANRENLAPILDEITFHHASLSEEDPLAQAVEDCDVVFHCAAQTSHPRSMEAPRDDIETNVLGTLELLETARRAQDPPRIVYPGTTTQLGPLVSRPADETHPEFPQDVYSASKTAAEKYLLVYARAHDLPINVIRLPNVYGPRAAIHDPGLGFVNYFIGLALQGDTLTVYGDGDQERNLLYVDDAVDALLEAAQTPALDGDTYLATGRTQFTVAEIAEMIAEALGGRAEHVPYPEGREALEVGDQVFSNDRFTDRTDWNPTTGLREGLKMTRTYYEGRTEAYLS